MAQSGDVPFGRAVVSRVTSRGSLLRERCRPAVDRTRLLSGRFVEPAVATVTSLGAAILVIGVVAWALAWQFGWVEMSVIATACLVLAAVAACFMIGSTKLEVSVIVEPPRVGVGAPLTGEFAARNEGRVPLLGARLELPIGTGGVAVDLPPLLPGKQHSELFVVPTQRRGLISVGPATSVRGDPVGVFRREVRLTERTEIFVHPRIVPLGPFGQGLIRDLEGKSSQSVSMSDLSFHALREYVPGDDLRHVHWRSSARHGQLLVRQFLDTRRSHLTAIVDSNPESYLSEEDYESALSVTASLMSRALRDEYDVSFLSAGVLTSGRVGRQALDGCARAEPTPSSVLDVAARATRMIADTSLLVLVTGPHAAFGTLQRAAAQFGVDVTRVAVRVDSSARAGIRTDTDLPVLTVSNVDELAGALRWGLA